MERCEQYVLVFIFCVRMLTAVPTTAVQVPGIVQALHQLTLRNRAHLPWTALCSHAGNSRPSTTYDNAAVLQAIVYHSVLQNKNRLDVILNTNGLYNEGHISTTTVPYSSTRRTAVDERRRNCSPVVPVDYQDTPTAICSKFLIQNAARWVFQFTPWGINFKLVQQVHQQVITK